MRYIAGLQIGIWLDLDYFVNDKMFFKCFIIRIW